MTRTTISKSCVVVIAMAPIIGAADAPYMGKWKLNPAKSQLTGQTAMIEKTASGAIRFATGAMSFVAKIDGKEYPGFNGGTIAWREVDANTWEITSRKGGRAANTYKLSLKDDRLTYVISRNGLDGAPIQELAVFQRLSGGPGFFGTWKTIKVVAKVERVELLPNGPDGLIYKEPDRGVICKAQFDGNDYPRIGLSAHPKITFAFKRSGPRSFEMVQKVDGKVRYVDVFTVSADGNRLTDYGNPPGKREPIKVVFDRQ